MKFREFKQNLKNEEYHIPNVLNKIKDNLPEINLKQPNVQKRNPKFRYAISFASLAIMLVLVFTAITFPATYNVASGPTNIDHFNSDEDITNTVKRYNRQKEDYINKEAEFFETYTMSDIPDLPDKRIYYSDNQTAKQYGNKVYYLNSYGLVVFDVSNNKLVQVYEKELNFDNTSNVKTLNIVNDNLIVIYKSSEYLNVVIYDINNMDTAFVYKIRSTYITSQIHDNKLFLVTILNDQKLPMIEVNNRLTITKPTDIGYLENVIGESYTILTTIDLQTRVNKETIFLSFNKWDIVHFSGDNLYLLNNHMNYKKSLNYGEYTTIVKFKDKVDGFNYQGSYTVKGSVPDKSNVYEYDNNLRLALQVTHYNVKRIFFFFTKITEVSHSINIVNFASTTVAGKPILELTNQYEITENSMQEKDSDFDQSISIISTKFNNNKIAVETRGIDTKITFLEFLDSHNIQKIEENEETDWYKIRGNIIPLDEDYGFSIRTIKTSTGEFEISFYDLTTDSPVEIKENYAYLNYSYLLEAADYIIIDAIQFANSLYLAMDEENYYIGFAVKNNLYNTNIDNYKGAAGTYTFIKIDKETKIAKFQDLTSNNVIIEKIVGTSADEIYGLSHGNIVRFKLNQYNNFVKTNTESIDYNK